MAARAAAPEAHTLLKMKQTACTSTEKRGLSFLQSASKIFHTQRPFSVLTLLAFGDEMYYICTEIWEEPRFLPFFVTFPLKTGILEAHPGKICLPLILICLPLILICLPLILICLPLSKTKRRVGKIGRRKVFSEVKNVNVESLKKRSKLLVFWAEAYPNPSLKGRAFQTST